MSDDAIPEAPEVNLPCPHVEDVGRSKKLSSAPVVQHSRRHSKLAEGVIEDARGAAETTGCGYTHITEDENGKQYWINKDTLEVLFDAPKEWLVWNENCEQRDRLLTELFVNRSTSRTAASIDEKCDEVKADDETVAEIAVLSKMSPESGKVSSLVGPAAGSASASASEFSSPSSSSSSSSSASSPSSLVPSDAARCIPDTPNLGIEDIFDEPHKKKMFTLSKSVKETDNSLVSSSLLSKDLLSEIQKFKEDGFAEGHFRLIRSGFIFKSKVPVGNVLEWGQEPIDKSLLNSSKSLDTMAVACYKQIMTVMGDIVPKTGPLSGNDKIVLSLAILNYGIQKQQLRDEVYCQLCKQIKQNPDSGKVMEGWKLLALCLFNFLPTREFEKFVTNFILSQHNVYAKESPSSAASKFSRWCLYRLERHLKMGLPAVPISFEEVERISTSGPKSHEVLFGASLQYIMQLQRAEVQETVSKEGDDESRMFVPRILTVLCNYVEEFQGFKQKGIFRLAAERVETHTLLEQIETKGDYHIEKKGETGDPNLPGDVLKHWLRSLAEPLIPMNLYNDALKVCEDSEKCSAFVEEKLDPVHLATLDYLLTFLARLAEHEEVTAMSPDNIAIVFCPDLLRNNEKNPAVIFKNSGKEKKFVSHLVEEWAKKMKASK